MSDPIVDKYTQGIKEMYALGRVHALELAVLAAQNIDDRQTLIVKLQEYLAKAQVAVEAIKEGGAQ